MRYIYFDNVRNNMSTKEEVEHLNKRGIELRDGFGNKIQSSSWLINEIVDFKNI